MIMLVRASTLGVCKELPPGDQRAYYAHGDSSIFSSITASSYRTTIRERVTGNNIWFSLSHLAVDSVFAQQAEKIRFRYLIMYECLRCKSGIGHQKLATPQISTRPTNNC